MAVPLAGGVVAGDLPVPGQPALVVRVVAVLEPVLHDEVEVLVGDRGAQGMRYLEKPAATARVPRRWLTHPRTQGRTAISCVGRQGQRGDADRQTGRRRSIETVLRTGMRTPRRWAKTTALANRVRVRGVKIARASTKSDVSVQDPVTDHVAPGRYPRPRGCPADRLGEARTGLSSATKVPTMDSPGGCVRNASRSLPADHAVVADLDPEPPVDSGGYHQDLAGTISQPMFDRVCSGPPVSIMARLVCDIGRTEAEACRAGRRRPLPSKVATCHRPSAAGRRRHGRTRTV